MKLKNPFNRTFNRKTTKNNAEDKFPHANSFHLLHSSHSFHSQTQIEHELKQVFNKFDVNGDGKISPSELGSIIGSLSHRPSEEELESMITEVDGNGDGFIDLNEFIELNTKGIGHSEQLENLKGAFSVFDADKNGLITVDELQSVLRSLGEEFSTGDCRKMIAGVDQDGDGMISFEEFKVMMMSGIEGQNQGQNQSS